MLGGRPPDGIDVPSWGRSTTSNGDRPHASYHDRARHREVGFSGSRRGCERQDRHSKAPAAGPGDGFFAKLAPVRVGIEACGTAHYWGRTLRALGHEVRLIPAAYVKPFVRRNKTDARDAAAICAALGRPDMRFVAIKSVDQQAARGVERARELMVKQRTQLMNCLRSQLAELGIIAAPGGRGFAELSALRRGRRCGDPGAAADRTAGPARPYRGTARRDRGARGADHGRRQDRCGDAAAGHHPRGRRARPPTPSSPPSARAGSSAPRAISPPGAV